VAPSAAPAAFELVLGGPGPGDRLRGYDGDDALKVVDGGELHDDLALILTHLHLHPGVEQIGEVVGDATETRGDQLGRGRPPGLPLGGVVAHSDDLIDGADRDDFLDGAAGRDYVNGGPGRDTVIAKGGEDVVYARDGEREWIDCGSGKDVAVVDSVDVVRHCEYVARR